MHLTVIISNSSIFKYIVNKILYLLEYTGEISRVSEIYTAIHQYYHVTNIACLTGSIFLHEK